MTCIVAIADSGRVVMGSDSTAAAPDASEIRTARSPRKVFRSGPYVIGFTVSFRIGQALAAAELPEPADECDLYRHMAAAFAPAVGRILRQTSEELGAIWASDKPGSFGDRGTLAVGIAGRLFGMTADLSVLELGGFLALGSGRAYAYGALDALGGQGSPEERVRAALAAAARFCAFVREPFHVETLEPSERLLVGGVAGS